MKKISGLVALALCVSSLAFDAVAATKDKSTPYQWLNLFGDVFERVKGDYVEEVDDQKLIESAINGMLTSLDPHSAYLNEKAFKDMQIQTKGEFGGLGIEVTMDNGLVKVVSPIDDTPAAKAGIKAADLISHINDEPVMGMTLSEAVEKMRGKVGTKVSLTVLREGEKEPLHMALTRAVIKIQSVRGRKEGDIAYLRITSFSEQTSATLKKTFTDLQQEIGKDKLKGIVLDLRNNPGGLLDQAIAVSDAFLERGEVVSTRGRTENSSKRYNAGEGDMTGNLPVVVLINGGSASAAEIVSGALQDHKRAVIMGTKSFGKGSVQTVIPIPDHGAMRLTTSRYFTPSGRSIQADGIVPDIVVEPSKVVPLKLSGMRKEADLKGHLEKDGSAKKAQESNNAESEDDIIEAMPAPESKDKDKDKDAKKPDSNDAAGKSGKDAAADDDTKDYQLQRALDFLHGVAFYKESQQTKPATPAK